MNAERRRFAKACEACEFGDGDGNTICEDCFNAVECDVCKTNGCDRCTQKNKCCGKYVCEKCDDSKHEKKTLECGHEICSLVKTCRTCRKEASAATESVSIEKDKVIVKKLLADASAVHSKSLRHALNQWFSDPEGIDRKRKRAQREAERCELEEELSDFRRERR
jgi:hypothetical protein